MFKKYGGYITGAINDKWFENDILSDLFFIKKRTPRDVEGCTRLTTEDHSMHTVDQSMIRLVTKDEDKDYERMKGNLKSKKCIDKTDVSNMISHLFFNYIDGSKYS